MFCRFGSCSCCSCRRRTQLSIITVPAQLTPLLLPAPFTCAAAVPRKLSRRRAQAAAAPNPLPASRISPAASNPIPSLCPEKSQISQAARLAAEIPAVPPFVRQSAPPRSSPCSPSLQPKKPPSLSPFLCSKEEEIVKNRIRERMETASNADMENE